MTRETWRGKINGSGVTSFSLAVCLKLPCVAAMGLGTLLCEELSCVGYSLAVYSIVYVLLYVVPVPTYG